MPLRPTTSSWRWSAIGRSDDPTAAAFLLTAREREVLQLVAEGHSNKDIAARLYLSPKTVGTYRERLMEKLEIHTVAGLVKYAIREGLTSSDPDPETEAG